MVAKKRKRKRKLKFEKYYIRDSKNNILRRADESKIFFSSPSEAKKYLKNNNISSYKIDGMIRT